MCASGLGAAAGREHGTAHTHRSISWLTWNVDGAISLESPAASAQIACRIPRQAMQPDTVNATVLLVNGQHTETDARTLADLVKARGFGETEVATALNGAFVPRSARAATLLRAGDKVEIVAPRQGG
jgi:sulfur carrier protein